MGFADRYVHALGASNLKDDAEHCQTEPLLAPAFAAMERDGDIGPLLHRVAFADTPGRNTFEGSAANLAKLLRAWTSEVIKRGRARKWVPENTAWDADAAQKVYRAVAEASLGYWLDSTCKGCGGTGVQMRSQCNSCGGSGSAELTMASGFIREHTLNMVSELHNIVSSHAARATSRLRAGA